MSQPQIIIQKINESYVKISCVEKYMEMEIQDKFSFEVPNAKHNPRVKSGKWDGYKRLYNRRNKTFPVGLVLALLRFVKGQGYSYKVDPELIPQTDLTREDIEHVMTTVIDPHSKGKPITPHEHQYDALMHMFGMGRSLCLSSTSSGKSLIIYSALRMLQLLPEMEDKKFFVVVPSGNLVEQMYNDFENYATGSSVKWNVGTHCQKINKDYKKYIDRQVVITTWQSMAKLPKYVFDDMKAVFVDECFHPDTNIMTPDGYVKISDIREGDLVINYNEKTKLFKEDVVVDVYKNMIKSSNDKMIELIFDNNSVIKVTENHKFLTTVGWIKAIDLNETHDVINTGTYSYSMSFINETKNEEV